MSLVMQPLVSSFVEDGYLCIAYRRTRSSDAVGASALLHHESGFDGAKVGHSLLHKDKLGALHKTRFG
jgi:hypothetical protein